MTKAMKRREVERAMRSNGCSIKSQTGIRDKWICSCGKHSANVPRHGEVTPGVIRDIIKRLECLEKGWLQ